MKHLKIVNKKRFITVITILIVLIITLSSLSFAKAKVETEEYVVSAGDTLWSIACEYKKTGQDVREYIYELRQLNNLNDCIIYPGQVLKIIK